MSIASLPILGAKRYGWDTALIQAGLRARTMSFNAITLQHAQGLLGLQDRSVSTALDGLLADLMNVTKPLLAGGALTTITLSVLNYAAETLNKLLFEGRDAFDIPDLYDWIQTMGTLASIVWCGESYACQLKTACGIEIMNIVVKLPKIRVVCHHY
jgi:hypothetical protein